METIVSKPELKTMNIKDYAKSNDIVSIVPTVKINTNGYPFLTMINSKNEAHNVYFSKAASKAVDAGTPVSKEMLAVYQIGITTNEAGKERIKLITNSARIDIASLLD